MASGPVCRQLSYGQSFRDLLDDLETNEFRHAFEEKFAIDLTGRPTTTIARGQCGPSDGQIHTDSTSKIITVLIYLNLTWEQPGGRLRLLRSGDDLDDVLAEIPPTEGTLLAFPTRRQFVAWAQAVRRPTPRDPIQLDHFGREPSARDAPPSHFGADQATNGDVSPKTGKGWLVSRCPGRRAGLRPHRRTGPSAPWHMA
jgi:hypothetical protein